MGIEYQEISVKLFNKKTGEKVLIKKKFSVPKNLVYKDDFEYYSHNVIYG